MSIVNNILKTSFSGILNITLGITNVLINLILGLVISIYILLEKESLKFQIKTIICKFMKDKHKRYVIETIKLTYSKFKKYIFGQTIDSFIMCSSTNFRTIYRYYNNNYYYDYSWV